MERKFKYLIENEKGQWFCSDVYSIQMCNNRRDCSCKKCRLDWSPDHWFSNNPLEAEQYDTLEMAERVLDYMKTKWTKTRVGHWKDGEEFFYVHWHDFELNIKSVDDCKVTEHEFVLAVTPINTSANGA